MLEFNRPRGDQSADGNFAHPFPRNESGSDHVSTLHFAPTQWAASNLLREGVLETSVAVTGNPGIDAVLQVCDFLTSGRLTSPLWDWLDPGRRLILVTAHRRESFGAGIESLCEALMVLAQRPDVRYLSSASQSSRSRAGVPAARSIRTIRLLEPLLRPVHRSDETKLLLTDSGRIQEEAPR
jgi:UDP-N-acetylglucosamine 2-epimerase (non-hydrolysing)